MQKYFTLALMGLLFQLCLSSNMLAQSPCDDRFTTPIFSQSDIIITQDVQYGVNTNINGSEKILKFDFYAPANAVDNLDKRPLIIWAHGGSFTGGNENTGGMQHISSHFAQKGYACASINYRLIDFATDVIPNLAQIDSLFLDVLVKAVGDMRAAIRFFRKDAANDNTYRIDPDQIFVGGISAGGILAIHTAYIDTDEGFSEYTGPNIETAIELNGGLAGNSGNPGFPTHVSGVVSLSGAVGDTILVQAGEEPLISIHTPEDEIVPFDRNFAQVSGFPVIRMDGSEVLHQRLDNLGIQNELLVFEEGGHVSYYGNPVEQAETDAAITQFLGTLVRCPNDVVSVSTNAITQTPPLRFYPNPASTALSIELNVGETPTTVLLFDSTGKQLQQFNVPGNNYINLDVADLAKGVYYVQVHTGIEQFTQSFMVQ